MELVNEHKIGITKGTAVSEHVEANFRGECTEVGWYLAMARQAQREGYPEAAEVLKTIAWEEAVHASLFAELNGMIAASTKENIQKMLAGEIGANKGKNNAAAKAKEAGLAPALAIFEESSRDEARHAKMLQGLLDRYFA